MKKIAIIDLGTNTFHLLIATSEGDRFNIILRDRLSVKLGKGGINAGMITEEGIQRALVAMLSFKNTLHQYEVDQVLAFGTSALRNSRNAPDVLERIHTLTGIQVKVITGEEEAMYIYEGVRTAVHLGKELGLIVDIGGGSVEFIIGNEYEAVWKQSVEIGAQRLLELFQKHDPITLDEIEQLYDYFDSTLQSLHEAMEQFKPEILVGSSGTFDTLSDIFCETHHISKAIEESESPLSIHGFQEVFEELLHKNREERLAIQGMIEMRVDMIVVASCLVNYLLTKYAFQRIRVSTYSLKEGVLASLIRRTPVNGTKVHFNEGH